MLKKLYIKNFAIVDYLEIEFYPGFQVLTGETGAGKSVIVGALSLLCGERSQSELVRSGAEKAVLEAEFQLEGEDYKKSRLENLIQDKLDNIFIVRREINVKGTSRAFVNDSPVNVNVLNLITAELIDLHGQHQHQRLIHPEHHISYLDAFGKLSSHLNEYKKLFKEFHELKNLLGSLHDKRKNSYERHDLYTFQVEELEKANLQPEEMGELNNERRILENSETLFEISQTVGTLLYSAEDSISNKVADSLNKLRQLAEIDPSFKELIKNIESAQLSVEECGRQCEVYSSNLEFNPKRLEEIRKREAELEWLMKKYQVNSVDDLVSRKKQMKKELDEIENFDDKIEQLEIDLEKCSQQLQNQALILSEKRKLFGKKLESKIEPLLSAVGLKDARFEVNIHWQEKKDGIISYNGKNYELTDTGIDLVEFGVGLNVGEVVRPLHKVASGGEVSRIMLSIKTLLADSDDINTLVFDEIDSGVSGRYAQIVGRKMYEISRRHQLLVITHLPQIAAFGDIHYSVLKEEKSGRTIVDVLKLEEEDRILDIAKLLGGENVTPQAIANARELIQQSKDIDTPIEQVS